MSVTVITLSFKEENLVPGHTERLNNKYLLIIKVFKKVLFLMLMKMQTSKSNDMVVKKS